jgi:hypothetical protein
MTKAKLKDQLHRNSNRKYYWKLNQNPNWNSTRDFKFLMGIIQLGIENIILMIPIGIHRVGQVINKPKKYPIFF